MIGTGFRLANVLMAMPPPGTAPDPWQSSLDPAMDSSQDPFQSPAQDPFQAQASSQTPSVSTKDPTLSKTKIGILVLIVGVLVASAFAVINTVLPLLLDPRLSNVAAIPLLLGAAIVFLGRRAWPTHRRSAFVGLALMVAGEGSAIFLSLFGYPYFLSFAPPTDVGSPYHRALMVKVIWEAANVTLVTVGILFLVWRITSETPRKLIIAGNLIFLGYYIAGHVLALVLYDPTVGGINLVAQPAVRILLEFFIIFFVVTNALIVLGLVVAQWRLPAPGSTASAAPT